MNSAINREHIAIVASNPSSYDAALSLKVQFEHRLKNSQPALSFDIEKHSLSDALEHNPSVVMVILGAPNSHHAKEVAQLVDTLRKHGAVPKPTLMLISSDHKKTMAALGEALQATPEDQAIASHIKVFPDYLNSITHMTDSLRQCLQIDGEPSISFASSTVSGPTQVVGNRGLLMATAPVTTLRKLG